MSKMGLHDPFGYLKHKLWPKEGPGFKLPNWLSTIKSQKSPWFTCVQVACNISLENSQQEIKLFFRPHFNRRSTQNLMNFQIHGNPNFGNFKIPNLGVLGQNDIWLLALWPSTKNTIKGKVVASPKSMLWWVLWVHVCPWFIRAPKVL
jgi:hypothetical protein